MELGARRRLGVWEKRGFRPTYDYHRIHGLRSAADRMEATSHNGYPPLPENDPGIEAAEAIGERSHWRRQASDQPQLMGPTQ